MHKSLFEALPIIKGLCLLCMKSMGKINSKSYPSYINRTKFLGGFKGKCYNVCFWLRKYKSKENPG